MKMWLFPVLSMVVVVAIVAVLVQMGVDAEVRAPAGAQPAGLGGRAGLLLRLEEAPGPRSRRGRRPGAARRATPASPGAGAGERDGQGPRAARRARGPSTASGHATYFVCVPANPIDTGQAMHEGAAFVWERPPSRPPGPARPDAGRSCATEGLEADGALGNYRPLRALAEAVEDVRPRPPGDLHAARGPVGLAALRRRRPGARGATTCRSPTSSSSHSTRPVGAAVTTVVGLAPGEHGNAALHLGAMVARSAGDDLVRGGRRAHALAAEPLPGGREYLALQEQRCRAGTGGRARGRRARPGRALPAAPGTFRVVRAARGREPGVRHAGRPRIGRPRGWAATSAWAVSRNASCTAATCRSRWCRPASPPRRGARVGRVTVGYGRADRDSDLLSQRRDRRQTGSARGCGSPASPCGR